METLTTWRDFRVGIGTLNNRGDLRRDFAVYDAMVDVDAKQRLRVVEHDADTVETTAINLIHGVEDLFERAPCRRIVRLGIAVPASKFWDFCALPIAHFVTPVDPALFVRVRKHPCYPSYFWVHIVYELAPSLPRLVAYTPQAR